MMKSVSMDRKKNDGRTLVVVAVVVVVVLMMVCGTEGAFSLLGFVV